MATTGGPRTRDMREIIQAERERIAQAIEATRPSGRCTDAEVEASPLYGIQRAAFDVLTRAAQIARQGGQSAQVSKV